MTPELWQRYEVIDGEPILVALVTAREDGRIEELSWPPCGNQDNRRRQDFPTVEDSHTDREGWEASTS
jgi:hypothetical protein